MTGIQYANSRKNTKEQLYEYNDIISYQYNDFFFFNDTATTEIYTLSLHDALPILLNTREFGFRCDSFTFQPCRRDRKSTRLNSSHSQISYAVFCLKKKKNPTSHLPTPNQTRTYTFIALAAMLACQH